MFSLISVDVTANLSKFEDSMRKVPDLAGQGMGQAAGSVGDFQTTMDQAAIAVGRSADMMAGNFKNASVTISQSGNQAIITIDKVAQAANDVDMRSWQEKCSAAFGAGVGAGTVAAQTWFDKLEDYASAKLKAIAIGMALTAVSVAAGVIYTAYNIISGSIGFIAGLFTGESYKSENIDALVTLNKEVKYLQDNLQLSAVQASAFNEALKAQAVDAQAYIATMDAVAVAVHNAMFSDQADATKTNEWEKQGNELDRLGVAYKDAQGNLLPYTEALKSAKTVLEGYTDGYDRQQAALAIGMGSYKQITDALKITDDAVAMSRSRLIDYNLIIGEGTQAAVTEYESAMRAFDRETDLMSQSFKKAIADQIMPALTMFAEWFSDGFPTVVNAFRYSMAALTSMFWGLQEVAYIVGKTIMEVWGSLTDMLARGAAVQQKAFSLDFAGAWGEMKEVPMDFGKRWDATLNGIIDNSKKAASAIGLAWGMDNLKAATGDSTSKSVTKKLKSWSPKVPKTAPAKGSSGSSSDTTSAFQTYVDELDRMIKKLDESQYAAMRLKLEQLALKEGISSTSTQFANAAAKVDKYQKSMEAVKLTEYVTNEKKLSSEYEFQTAIIGKTRDEQARLTIARKETLDVENAIAAAEKAHLPMSLDGIEKMRMAAHDAAQQSLQDLDARNAATSVQEQATKEAAAYSASAATMQAMLNARTASGYYTTLESMRAEGVMNREKIAELQEVKSSYEAMGAAGAVAAQMIEAQIIELSAHLDPIADKLRGMFEGAFEGLFNDLGKVIMGTMSVKDAFKNMVTSILDDLWKLASKEMAQQIMKLLGNGLVPGQDSGIFGWLSNLVVPFSRGIGNDIATTGAGIFSVLSGLPSFAVGTDFVPRDMVAQIHQGERIVPAAQNNADYGNVININVHVNGSSSAPDVRRAAGQGAREALAALNGARRYG